MFHLTNTQNAEKNCTQSSNKARNVKTHLFLFGVVSLKSLCVWNISSPASAPRQREDWNRKQKKKPEEMKHFFYSFRFWLFMSRAYEPRDNNVAGIFSCLDKEFVYLRPDATLQVRSDNCDGRWVTRRNFNCLLWLWELHKCYCWAGVRGVGGWQW